MFCNEFFKRLGVHTVAIDRRRNKLCAIQPEALNGGQKGGPFHNDFVARADHGFANEVQRLLAACGHNQLFGFNILHALLPHEMRQLIAQRAIAFCGAILKCGTWLLRQGQRRGFANALHIKHGAVWEATGKADDARLAQKFEQLPDGRGFDIVQTIGKLQGHGVSSTKLINFRRLF